MTSRTSEFAELFSESTKLRIKKTSSILQALAIVGVLFVSGGVTGYWIADKQCDEQMLVQDRMHQEEIKRTVETYGKALDYLTGRVKEAASTSVDAAQSAESAAAKAAAAAGDAKTASKAAQSATRAAEKVPEPTRDQINRNVQRANSGIKTP
jgi:uncharacterized protein YneF (UPF0154 family)